MESLRNRNIIGSYFFILLGLLFLTPHAHSDTEEDSRRRVLKSLTTVGLAADSSPEGEKVGLTPDVLESELEKLLKAAHLNITRNLTSGKQPPAIISVKVFLTGDPEKLDFVYGFMDLKVNDVVMLQRNHNSSVIAATWEEVGPIPPVPKTAVKDLVIKKIFGEIYQRRFVEEVKKSKSSL